MSDKSSGPITWKPKSITINGKRHKRRRLGPEHGFWLIELGTKAVAIAGGGITEIEDIDALSMGDMVGLIGKAIRHPDLQDDIYEFLAETVEDFPLSVEDMHDPDKFPIQSVPAMIVSLLEDEDVADFFGYVKKLWKLQKKLRGAKKGKAKK